MNFQHLKSFNEDPLGGSQVPIATVIPAVIANTILKLLASVLFKNLYFLTDLSKKDKEKPISYLDHTGHVVNMGNNDEEDEKNEKNQKDVEKHEDGEKDKGHHNSIADDIDLAMSETKWEFKDKDFRVTSDDHDHSIHFGDHGHTKPKYGHTGSSTAKSSPHQTNQFEVLTSESKGSLDVLCID